MNIPLAAEEDMAADAPAFRVVHLSVVHRPGDARIYDRECRTLAEAGYDVTYLVPGGPDAPGTASPRQVALPGRSRSRRWMSVNEIAGALRRLRPHVLHIHDPELLTIVPVVRPFVPRVAYDMHEYLPEQVAMKPYIPQRLRPAAASLTRAAQRALAGACHGVITVTEQQLDALGPRPAGRLVLPNYPRYARFAAARHRPAASAGQPLALVYIGSLSRSRGLLLMLDALAALGPEAPVSLALGGHFADPSDEALVRARVRHELAGRVTLLGPVDPVAVPTHLAAADVVWSPSVAGPQFNLPTVDTKIFEGMAAGLAVLTTNLPGRGEIIRTEECGLAVTSSVEGHAGGLLRLLGHRDEVRRMGERGRAAVRERYSWESIEGRLVGFYARLCQDLGKDRP